MSTPKTPSSRAGTPGNRTPTSTTARAKTGAAVVNNAETSNAETSNAVTSNAETGGDRPRRCLVTGATGYVGGRLAPALRAAGFDVVVLARRPERIAAQSWGGDVTVHAGDASDADAVRTALDGVHTAFYLLHAIGTGPGYAEREQATAAVFGAAAAEAGVAQIVYLGGLANDEGLSEHLSSRVAVGQALRGGGVPVLELRAGVILGSGSASFEMLRYLTERLPVMVAPRWINNRIQPIAIADVLDYLINAARLEAPIDAVCDIAGPEVLTYQQMMQRYARLAGLAKRHIVKVGVLTPKLSSHWVGLVTPVPSALAKPLVRSLINDAVADTERAPLDAIAIDEPCSFDEAVRRALRRDRGEGPATRWSDAGDAGLNDHVDWALPAPSDPHWSGGTTRIDKRSIETVLTPAQVWPAIERIGGQTGYYGADWAWWARGFLDRILGGVGLRRGRRDRERLRVGDAVDFWRVEALDRPHLLRLRAEMHLPGEAWLEFYVEEAERGSRVTQQASFFPRGLWGLAYWWAVAPFHHVVFPRMLRGVVASAVSGDDQPHAG